MLLRFLVLGTMLASAVPAAAQQKETAQKPDEPYVYEEQVVVTASKAEEAFELATREGARYLGIDASRPCPVCKGSELRLLAYVYADGLRQNNGRAFQIEDAMTLASAHRGGTCYVVEVCTDCCWNHLSKALVAREGQWNLPAAAGNGSLALTSPSPRNLH